MQDNGMCPSLLIAACSLQEYEVPDSLPSPGDMQTQLETLCKAA